MPRRTSTRLAPEGHVPLLDIEGTPYECGVTLGNAWAPTLARVAERTPSRSMPWWGTKPCSDLVSRYAPHLPDLYCGMAKGAGVAESSVGTEVPLEGPGGCTSFAVAPNVTLDGRPISGQTKDTPVNRVYRYIVLRLKLTGAPSALTLTYPGWLFGHGFVAGGCALFRNSLYAGPAEGELPFPVWGILALHGDTVEQVVELTRRHGVGGCGHCTVADEHGGIVGIEVGKGGVAFLRPKRGIYTHANHVAAAVRLRRHEDYEASEARCSRHRASILHERLGAERRHLTTQLAYAALCDHGGYPSSVCRHQPSSYTTTAAVVAEPNRRLLYVARGSPCQNWPRRYQL